jgi:hypothetical protein
VNSQRERAAAVHFLELSRTTVKSVKFLNLVGCYFRRRLISVNAVESSLGTVKGVDTFDNLSGVLFEQKHEELVLAGL